MMRPLRLGAVVLLALFLAAPAVRAGPFTLKRVNRRLAGAIVDHTNNHGADRRIWSAAICAPVDLYVYLPPGYDPCRRYPLMIWLHGILQDEQTFLEGGLGAIDAAMACGKLAPAIIAVPDGNVNGRPTLLRPRTLFLNSDLGNYEDLVVHDVWGFVCRRYPIRPERGAHVLAGFSGGGGAAYRIAIRYKNRFGAAAGISPPLNLRWLNCRGRYLANFEPCCWGWREDVSRSHESVGRFYGVVNARLGNMLYPLYGRGPAAVEALSRENPIEMLEHYDVRPRELAMFIAYGGKDQFNIDAQVESFLYRARQRGLCVDVAHAPHGRHNLLFVEKFLPRLIDWLNPLLEPYRPDRCVSPLPGPAVQSERLPALSRE